MSENNKDQLRGFLNSYSMIHDASGLQNWLNDASRLGFYGGTPEQVYARIQHSLEPAPPIPPARSQVQLAEQF